MKKKSVIAAVGMMSLWLAACGQAGGTGNVQTEPSVVETVQETQSSEAASVVEETQAAQTEAPAEPTVPVQTEAPVQTGGSAETEAVLEASSTETQASSGYEDNFAVDSEAQVKEAVAAQDLEALADLAAYPLYVGFTDGSVNVTSREEFVALGAERVFTPELVESVGNADVNSLSPSMAGFALSSNDGPNIIFSVVNGSLAIQGINY